VDVLVKRLEPKGGQLSPATQGVATDLHAVADAKDLLLPVKRQMVAVFGDQDVCDEPGRSGQAILQAWWQLRGHRRSIAVGDFHKHWPDQTPDEDPARLVVETVAAFFTDAPPRFRTCLDRLGQEHFFDDRQMVGNALAPRLALNPCDA